MEGSSKANNIEPMSKVFAKVLEIMAIVGLVIMLVPGFLTMTGENVYVDPQHAIHNWDKPAEEFWKDAKGIEIHGYGWFLDQPTYFDSISLIGVIILALAPMIATIISLPLIPRAYKLILLIVLAELAFAIVRPLIIAGGGH